MLVVLLLLFVCQLSLEQFDPTSIAYVKAHIP